MPIIGAPFMAPTFAAPIAPYGSTSPSNSKCRACRRMPRRSCVSQCVSTCVCSALHCWRWHPRPWHRRDHLNCRPGLPPRCRRSHAFRSIPIRPGRGSSSNACCPRRDCWARTPRRPSRVPSASRARSTRRSCSKATPRCGAEAPCFVATASPTRKPPTRWMSKAMHACSSRAGRFPGPNCPFASTHRPARCPMHSSPIRRAVVAATPR